MILQTSPLLQPSVRAGAAEPPPVSSCSIILIEIYGQRNGPMPTHWPDTASPGGDHDPREAACCARTGPRFVHYTTGAQVLYCRKANIYFRAIDQEEVCRLMRPKQQAVWNKTDGRCWYCGAILVEPNPEDESSKLRVGSWFCMDHVVPKSDGGTKSLDNLVPACWTCNVSKGKKSLEEYRTTIEFDKVGAPYFSPRQRRWLADHGIQIPRASRHEFWAEGEVRWSP